MKKLIFTTILLIFFQIELFAQAPFAGEQLPITPQAISTNFKTGYNCSSYDADLNGDGIPEIILYNNQYRWSFIEFYQKDTNNNYYTILNNIYYTLNAKYIFADFNNDNSTDFLITGEGNASLYINDGNANFTHGNTSAFSGLYISSIDSGDIDHDGDIDIIATASDNGQIHIEIFTNDGNAIFTRHTPANFTNIQNASIKLFDINNDGYLDFINYGSQQPKIYLNNGSNNFSEIQNSGLTTILLNSYISIGDYNNDGLSDILIAGEETTQHTKQALLYQNSGNNHFSIVNNTPFTIGGQHQIEFVDMDNDNDLDVVVAENENHRLAIYTNDGTGQFTQDINNGIDNINNLRFNSLDSNNDGQIDLFITGQFETKNASFLYTNDGYNHFDLHTDSISYGLSDAASEFGDIDGDGDKDLIISGYNGFKIVTKLMTNDGNGIFSEVQNTHLSQVKDAHIALKDIDNDGDLDLFLAGTNADGVSNKIYTNDGNGNFTEMAGVDFLNARVLSMDFGDIDGDQNQDLIITYQHGYNHDFEIIMYQNDGNGNFTAMQGTNFISRDAPAVAFADIDNDNDVDLLITGQYVNYDPNDGSYIYFNDGQGNFTQSTQNNILALTNAKITFIDIDNDNDLDLIINGLQESYLACTNCHSSTSGVIYTNDGQGNFTEINTNAGFYYGDIDIADIDNDGDIDLIITGVTVSGQNIWDDHYEATGGVLENDGTGNFTQISYNVIFHSSVSVADIDNDGDMDYVLIGKNAPYGYGYYRLFADIYRNTTISGIKDYQKNTFNIYPNPTNGNFSILFNESINTRKYTLNIYTFSGQKIQTFASNEFNNYQIPLPKGFYFVEIVNNKQVFRKKMIVN